MEERFHYLFQRYLGNLCTHQELEEFFSIVHQSENDQQLRALVKKVYMELGEVTFNTTHVDETGRLVLTDPNWMTMEVQKSRRPRTKVGAILVAALVIIIAGGVWLTRPGTGNKKAAVASLTKKATNRSESKFVLLEDSTQVWLNAASTLEFPDQFDSRKREVFLTGEAFFDVKHAERLPFIIHTGNISTTVLGTAFNIKAYPGQKNIIISVSRGKVRITRNDGWETVLVRGQQLKLKEDGGESIEKNVAPGKIAGWQEGNIVFEDETLEDIIADMQRQYNVEIRIMLHSIADLKISTAFKREIGVEQALQVLCKLTDTELRKTDGVYIIQ
ncbi:MAG: FecR domain-containing protein [Chitinophagaceae bacterium]|nr:FecR domain-containing protein [Chitinophagaceae bacterium]